MINKGKNRNLELLPSDLKMAIQNKLNENKNRKIKGHDSKYIDIEKVFISTDLYDMWCALTKYDVVKIYNFCNCIFALPIYLFTIEEIIAREKLILDVKCLQNDLNLLQKRFIKLKILSDEYSWNELIENIEDHLESLRDPIHFTESYMVITQSVGSDQMKGDGNRSYMYEKHLDFAKRFINRKKLSKSVYAIHAAKILAYSNNKIFGKPHLNYVAEITNVLFDTSYDYNNVNRHWNTVKSISLELPFAI